MAACFAVCALAVVGPGKAAAPASEGTKVRGGLAALLAGRAKQDPRVARLTRGYRKGELVYFAVLSGSSDSTRAAILRRLGARVLRSYRSIDALALASRPAVARKVAALAWVRQLQPVEVVTVAGHESPVDQTKATTADVGAPAWWSQGVTGSGVRVAVIDTGVDPAHPDLDDLDFGHWSSVVNARKLVDARNFVGSGCEPLVGATDGHGHGTHVAAIAVGTGEGDPLTGNGRGKYAGIAPGAELAVGKALTDAGAGLNSDLIAALEWAAMPVGSAPCTIGADVVNLSLGSESRPTRLNSGSDIDLVSVALNRLAVRYGTLFVAAAGNSGPFVGSVLEAPGSAAQALSVAAAAKDYDLNHDDTYSGDTCAGWQHPPSKRSAFDNDCSGGTGTQPPSVAPFSSRGPSGDLWLRPDVAAPGYNIVSAQSAHGGAMAANDLNLGTRADALYATASGTSMASPATAGSAALVLDAYRRAHLSDPAGASGVAGLGAPKYALLRAALMNTAVSDLYESRWILTTDARGLAVDCSFSPDPLLLTFCELGTLFTDLIPTFFGSLTAYEARNKGADPYVGPLAEGAGKVHVGRAISALRDGVVVYSAASGSGADAGTGPRDFQGSWQVSAIAAGSSAAQRFVVHAAPSVASASVTFSFAPGNPSDGSRAIVPAKGSWTVKLPGKTAVRAGRDQVVSFGITAPANAAPGSYTGVVLARVSNGQTLRIPVFASVALHDSNTAAGAVGAQATVTSARDVYAKSDTSWPSVLGASGTGAGADWLVYPVELAGGLTAARFSVHDAVAGDETYDVYVYDAKLNLVASTHPFVAPGVTDAPANDARGSSTQASPQALTLTSPAGGRYYVAVNRAKIGGTSTGDLGAFVLRLDEVG